MKNLYKFTIGDRSCDGHEKYSDIIFYTEFSKEKILVLRSEDLFASPEAVVRETWSFLGLSDKKLKNAKPHNVGRYNELGPNLRAELTAYFRPYNDALSKYLDMEFHWDN